MLRPKRRLTSTKAVGEDAPRLRQVLAGLPQPEAADGCLVLAVDVTHWLRPDAPTSADRLFCHVYGRSGRSSETDFRARFLAGCVRTG